MYKLRLFIFVYKAQIDPVYANVAFNIHPHNTKLNNSIQYPSIYEAPQSPSLKSWTSSQDSCYGIVFPNP